MDPVDELSEIYDLLEDARRRMERLFCTVDLPPDVCVVALKLFDLADEAEALSSVETARFLDGNGSGAGL